jgi:NTE family protein
MFVAAVVRKTLLLFIFITACSFFSVAQKVGLVLSGGGSSGMVHIGVLKALEEHNIPVDYIAGTSAGGLVGGMYAAGMTPAEMEAYVTSREFINISKGVIEEQYLYYFKSRDEASDWISIRFNRDKDSVFKAVLPTNIMSPFPMDFSLMELSSAASAACNYNFDSLFIPFRCVAADVANKKQVIFRKGNLSEAIRSTISYPFYLKPITVDGQVLFDGGLYNNFPADVVLEDFYPDIIIGSTVAANTAPPDEDNVISQIKNMLMMKTDYSVICENGIIIEPQLNDIGLFDFTQSKYVIDEGYNETIKRMPEIKAAISRRVSVEERSIKRNEFLKKKDALVFDNIYINGLSRYEALYVERSLRKSKNENISVSELRKRYFKLVADDKIKKIYPRSKINRTTGFYDLYLDIQKDNDFIAQFGGNFASRSINNAFIGLQYKYLGVTALSISANTYFGRFYTSGQIKGRIDFPFIVPFYLEAGATINQWNYFNSATTFFETIKPSFFVSTDTDGEISVGMPATYKGKVVVGVNGGQIINEYYQTKSFLQTDTKDDLTFKFISTHASYETNTHNRKQYANKGRFFNMRVRYVQADVYETPGTTGMSDVRAVDFKRWIQAKVVFNNYFRSYSFYKLGIYAEAVYSSQPFFANYSSTVQFAPAFEPFPESSTLFYPDFRANQYVGLGARNVFEILKNLDLRVEGYAFQPWREIIRKDDFTADYADKIKMPRFMASFALVFSSPIAPVSFSANFYDKQDNNWSFLFNVGYILFNKKALD